MCVECLLTEFVRAFIQVLAFALTACVFVRVILSWVQVRLPLGLNAFVFDVTEPILAPIRRVLPGMGGFDLSPMIAILLINLVANTLLTLVGAAI